MSEKLEKYRKCHNCGFDEILKTKRNCPKCKKNLNKSKLENKNPELSEDVEGNMQNRKPTVRPTPENPKEYRVLVEQGQTNVYKLNLLEQIDCSVICEDKDITKIYVQPPIFSNFVNPCPFKFHREASNVNCANLVCLDTKSVFTT